MAELGVIPREAAVRLGPGQDAEFDRPDAPRAGGEARLRLLTPCGIVGPGRFLTWYDLVGVLTRRCRCTDARGPTCLLRRGLAGGAMRRELEPRLRRAWAQPRGSRRADDFRLKLAGHYPWFCGPASGWRWRGSRWRRARSRRGRLAANVVRAWRACGGEAGCGGRLATQVVPRDGTRYVAALAWSPSGARLRWIRHLHRTGCRGGERRSRSKDRRPSSQAQPILPRTSRLPAVALGGEPALEDGRCGTSATSATVPGARHRAGRDFTLDLRCGGCRAWSSGLWRSVTMAKTSSAGRAGNRQRVLCLTRRAEPRGAYSAGSATREGVARPGAVWICSRRGGGEAVLRTRSSVSCSRRITLSTSTRSRGVFVASAHRTLRRRGAELGASRTPNARRRRRRVASSAS